jgi:hypothetical protein
VATWDTIDNLSLIDNGLVHLDLELGRKQPSYFRIAREAHLILYRSMIEALKGSANLAVTGRPPKDRSYRYQKGRSSQPWYEIHEEAVTPCKKAWRFSTPATCKAPRLVENNRQTEPGDYLIGFYDALAMIQTDCFMGHFVHSRIVPVSDPEMRTLEWLHERIRNEYEHFVPKYYTAPVTELAAAAAVCVRLSKTLLFESGNVLFHGIPREELERRIDTILGALQPGPPGDSDAKGPASYMGFTKAQWEHLFERVFAGFVLLVIMVVVLYKVIAESSAAFSITFLVLSVATVSFNVRDVGRRKLGAITVVLWVSWLAWLLYGALWRVDG